MNIKHMKVFVSNVYNFLLRVHSKQRIINTSLLYYRFFSFNTSLDLILNPFQ